MNHPWSINSIFPPLPMLEGGGAPGLLQLPWFSQLSMTVNPQSSPCAPCGTGGSSGLGHLNLWVAPPWQCVPEWGTRLVPLLLQPSLLLTAAIPWDSSLEMSLHIMPPAPGSREEVWELLS